MPLDGHLTLLSSDRGGSTHRIGLVYLECGDEDFQLYKDSEFC
jgi:hypothetical protein